MAQLVAMDATDAEAVKIHFEKEIILIIISIANNIREMVNNNLKQSHFIV